MNEEFKQYIQSSKKNLILIYVLFLCSPVAHLLSIIGVIFAYVNQDAANPVLRSHYIYAIRTFWIGLIGGVVAFITTFIFIGPLVYIAVCIWFIVRVIIGLRLLVNDKEHLRPKTWFLN